jgi:tetratricopeptide (TPR) repeat protein
VESREQQVAHSLLDDVDLKVDQFEQLPRQHQREKLAKEILKGDLARAKAQIDAAEARGEDVSIAKSRVLFTEGCVYRSVAESEEIDSLFTSIIINKWMRKKYLQNYINKWAGQALDCFNRSIQASPTQAAYYNQGLCFWYLERKQEAANAFNLAQQGEDSDISMQAAKAIARMNEKQGFCFVATACYGSYDHPDVMTFREWRDSRLLRTSYGRVLVGLYYRFSPPVAERVARLPRVATFIRRAILQPLACRLRTGRSPHDA